MSPLPAAGDLLETEERNPGISRGAPARLPCRVKFLSTNSRQAPESIGASTALDWLFDSMETQLIQSCFLVSR